MTDGSAGALGAGSNNSHVLPQDCVASILSSLTRQADRKAAAFVCKDWFRVALSTWTVRFFSAPHSVGLDRVLSVFKSLCSCRLNLSSATDTEDALSALSTHCRGLARLSVHGGGNGTAALLSNSRFGGLSELVSNCQSLTALEISGFTGIGEEELAAIVTNLHELRELDLCGCDLQQLLLSGTSSSSSFTHVPTEQLCGNVQAKDLLEEERAAGFLGPGGVLEAKRESGDGNHPLADLTNRLRDGGGGERGGGGTQFLRRCGDSSKSRSRCTIGGGVVGEKKGCREDDGNGCCREDCCISCPPILLAGDPLLGVLLTRASWCLRNLESIALDGCGVDVTNEGIVELSKRCRRLRHVGLPRVVGVLDEGLRAVARCCQSLERLSIHGSQLISYRSLRLLGARSRSLSRLSMGVIAAEAAQGLTVLLSLCASLRELELVRVAGGELGAAVASAIASHGRYIEVLDVFSMADVGGSSSSPMPETASSPPACWMSAIGGCPSLTLLCLRDCPRMNDGDLRVFSSTFSSRQRSHPGGRRGEAGGVGVDDGYFFSRLTSLSLMHADVSGSGLVWVKKGCHSLKTLDLRFSRVAHLQALKAGGGERWTSIEEINLEGCEHIDDDDMDAVGDTCPNLRSLNISECLAVGDRGVRWLSCRGRSRLEFLDMRRTPRVTGQGFLSGFPRLQKLRLTHCRLNEEGLDAIVDGCVKLKDLTVVSCFKVTDEGLRSLAGCRDLETLAVESCSKVTATGIWELAKDCTELSEVVVSSCDLVTPVDVVWLSEKMASRRRGGSCRSGSRP